MLEFLAVMKKPLIRFVTLALAVALATIPARSQRVAAESTASHVFGELVHVEIINIDVYVTDKHDEPIHGLTKDDFLLFVDGKAAPISNFYAFSSSTEEPTERRDPLAPQTTQIASPADDGITARPEKPSDQRLYVVVYIDNFNLTPGNRNRVLRELRMFLDQELSPDDQVMLVSYDRSIHLRHPFTTDHRQISRALLELEDLSAQRVHRDRERQELFAMVNDKDFEHRRDTGDVGYYEGVALNQLQTYAESTRNDMHFTIDSLFKIVESLAGSPGRKAVVYVSDGIPMIAGEDLFYFINQVYEGALSMVTLTEFNLSRRFEELAAKANANRVSFYTIDARGLTVGTSGTIEQANAGMAGQQAFLDSIWVNNLQQPLQLMAEETGGKAILNANRIMPDLLEMGSDFENYYSLGYSPQSAGDGRYHSLEVKLKNPKGRKVRHRSGYRHKSTESQMIEGTLSALNLDLQDNPLEANVRFGRPKRRGDGNFDIPIHLQVPFEKLTLLEQDGIYYGQLRVWFAAKDEKDHSTEAQEIPVDIRIPSDRIGETEGRTYTYSLELVMEGGYHDFAVGMRDELGARQAFLRRGIDVGGET